MSINLVRRAGGSTPHLSARFLLSAFVMMFVAGAGSAAYAETRTLKMYFTHTKESATITFKKNGKYVKSGLRKANRFLRDWRRKEPTRMDPALLDLVWEVYQKSGSRKPIQVISGYRSPRTNKMLRRRGRGVAKSSQHTKGKALDFRLTDVSVKKLRALGLKAHRGGVGYYPGSFVHLDTGRVRHWPRMSRRELARVFPRGRTIHVPSNGKPLKGYKTAMANLKKGRNADGSSRKTRVRPTLIAGLFNRSSRDDTETAKPKKAEPKAVVVARAERKPTGPDPLAIENAANQKREAAQAIQLASLAIPVRRPSRDVPGGTAQGGELAVAAPDAALDILRPRGEIPTLEGGKRKDLQERVTVALASTPSASPVASALEAQATTRPVPRARFGQDTLAQRIAPGATTLGATRPSAPLTAEEQGLVQQASLTAQDIRQTAGAVTGSIAKPEWRKQAVTLPQPATRTEADVRVPLPSINPQQPVRLAGLTVMRTGAKAAPAKLQIGELNSRSVKAWAIASSTRVGALAKLQAPNYKNCHKQAMPALVYAQGFSNEPLGLRADRFTGKTLVRVASTEKSYQVSLR